jgi:G6PDH family F420-dependent oxidoreductase
MTRFGYTLMTEQSGPVELVQYARAAEQVGFDVALCSDHFSPWLPEQGHAPYAWTLLGAVAQATENIELASYVTCPTERYHPVVVAQKAATLQLLSGGRFTLGLGSGENLNEHVIGQGWPTVEVRQQKLVEAIKIIRELFGGRSVTTSGEFFRASQARLWDCPDDPVPIAVAVSGEKSIERFAPLAEHLVTVSPEPEILQRWQQHHPDGGAGSRSYIQLPICWAPDEQTAIELAHEQFRWFSGGWPVNAELTTPASFTAATQYVRPEDVADAIPCGPDLDRIVDTFRPAIEAGFTDVALVQVGDRFQSEFLDQAARPLLDRLRDAASTAS